MPEPEFYEERDSFKVIFRNNSVQQSDTQSGQVSGQVIKYKKKVLDFCIIPKSTNEIKEYLGIKSRSYVREKIIKPLIDSNLLDYTNNSHKVRNQKYITINIEKN